MPRDVRSRRSASRSLVGLSNLSRARLEMPDRREDPALAVGYSYAHGEDGQGASGVPQAARPVRYATRRHRGHAGALRARRCPHHHRPSLQSLEVSVARLRADAHMREIRARTARAHLRPRVELTVLPRFLAPARLALREEQAGVDVHRRIESWMDVPAAVRGAPGGSAVQLGRFSLPSARHAGPPARQRLERARQHGLAHDVRGPGLSLPVLTAGHRRNRAPTHRTDTRGPRR